MRLQNLLQIGVDPTRIFHMRGRRYFAYPTGFDVYLLLMQIL
jgi:hypothetical protein